MGKASREKRARRAATENRVPAAVAARVGALGSVSVLNVGAGDLTLSFDKANAVERERAKKVVQDMLKRGYAILVQVGADADGEPFYRRVKAFDPATCDYIVVGVPEDGREPSPDPRPGLDDGPPADRPPRGWTRARRAAHEARKRGRGRETRIPAESTRTVAVARSAGG